MSLNPNSATRREFSEQYTASPLTFDQPRGHVRDRKRPTTIRGASEVEEPRLCHVGLCWPHYNPGRSQDEAWRDAIGSSQLVDMLLQDESRGDSMHRMTWGSGFDARFPFGNEIKQGSTAVVNATA
ncbi:hypothetical protein TWF102_008288 [Orbilia oligospora]|uniref:Uncharacterized protein n=1 Tax=Orbilia oligospora TaxID=2813651 RepID=A0A7C8J6N8_ORBOL|nr:hypothetical protein TWF706_001266 [Orbilia oligospora]KAF3092785.1 hypothetical protein TWF102_008288 [Orbilia oligospora]KAF3093659.1 hypothetical protein TWF103_010734 [Orbilia oligospora]